MTHAQNFYTRNEAIGLIGCSRSTFDRYFLPTAPFRTRQIGKRTVYEKASLEAWLAGAQKRKVEDFVRTVAGSGNVDELPVEIEESKHATALRIIAVTGDAPEGVFACWRNARKNFGSPPADVLAAFGLATGARWALAVERAEDILTAPHHRRPLLLKQVADRLSAYRADEADEALS